ncbi:MAG: energy transducer TonB [Longimicrobiaceae bacterium]
MTYRLALSGALAVLVAGCASAGAAGSAPAPTASAACAPALDDARLAAAFDSLHALRQSRRRANDLVLVPSDREPQLQNASEVQRLLVTLYPAALRSTGVTGRTEVALLIDESGTVRDARLVGGSTHPDFDQPALLVSRGMRFRPARKGRCPVPFFATIPISWVLIRNP